MLKGADGTESLLRKYNIKYVVIGPSERRDYQANELYYRDRYPVVLESVGTHVYKIGRPDTSSNELNQPHPVPAGGTQP